MARRRFAIKGTKDFLVLAVFCAALCVWSVRDAWFPTKKILKKHPREISVAFSVPGVVERIAVAADSDIAGKMLLAKLYDESCRVNVLNAEAAVKTARSENAPDLEAKVAEMLQAHEALNACTLENTDPHLMRTTSHGEEALRGRVIRVLVTPASKVEVLRAESAGQVSKITEKAVFVSAGGDAKEDSDVREYKLDGGMTPLVKVEEDISEGRALAGTSVMLVKPVDTFYMFNQTLAVLTFIGMLVALFFHWIASR
jgi:hypothetical protein